ncbi:MAG: putative porin [Candidatus Omnitrophota bacterium]
MKKFLIATVLICFGVLGFYHRFSYAGEVDILVEKLVQKGVLTHGEAQEILAETKEAVKAQLAAGKSESVPSWVQNIKLKGDLRTRYQWERQKGSGNQNERMRLRFRYGMDAKVNDKASAHLQLATGARNDLRSTNQTLNSNSNEAFGHYDLWIDQAYMDYAAFPYLTLMAGKMPLKSVFYQTGDILLDTDINPDGASLVFNKPLTDRIDSFINAGWWILNDGSKSADTTMSVIQPGIKVGLNENMSLELAGGYLHYNSLKGKDVDVVVSSKSSDTNSLEGTGLKYDFNSYIFSAKVDMNNALSFLPIPYLAVFGDYVNNPDPADDNDGFIVGLTFGDKKVKDRGQWQGQYSYREVGKDAVLDIFPDSDALGGGTDVRSHEFILSYGLAKNIALGLDYYLSERMKAAANDHSKEHLIQADVVYKF